MTNLRDHTIAWLESIGADGLMVNMSLSDHVYLVGSELERAIESWGLDMLVPAFRHADGSYHVEPECCVQCRKDHEGFCAVKWECCSLRKSWLSHKEAK